MPTTAYPSTAAALILVSLLLAPLARADETPIAALDAPRNTITSNPLRFPILHFQIEYERTIAESWALFVSPIVFHHATWYPFAPSHDLTANGYGLDFGSRYFFSGSAPSGAFVGPYLAVYRGEVFQSGVRTLEGYVLSPGAQGGYTRMFGPLVLSAGAGLSYGLATREAPAGSPRSMQLPHHGPWVNFRANAGYAF